MRIGLLHAAGQFGINPYIDPGFAQHPGALAMDETGGLIAGKDHAGESVAQSCEQLSGSLLRCEQGSIEE